MPLGRAPKRKGTSVLVLSPAVLFVVGLSGQPVPGALRLRSWLGADLRHPVLTHNFAYDAVEILLRDPEMRQGLPEVSGHVVPGERRVDWLQLVGARAEAVSRFFLLLLREDRVCLPQPLFGSDHSLVKSYGRR